MNYSQSIQEAIPLESLALYQISIYLRRIGLPLIFIAGTFGNILVVIVQKRLAISCGQDSSMAIYLSALAISDLMSLWAAPVFWWLETLGINVSPEYDVPVCKYRVWIVYTLGQTSAWFLVAMTVHRALHVATPLRTRNILNKRTTISVVVFISVFCVLMNAHIIYGHTILKHVNGTDEVCFFSFATESYDIFFNGVWAWTDISLCSFIPFVLLFVANTVMVKMVKQSLNEAKKKLEMGDSEHFKARIKKVSSMTLTLICISVAFLFLASPLCAYMMAYRTLMQYAKRDVTIAAACELTFAVGLLLWYANCAINFYVYCITGSKYREEFVRVFRCKSG